MKSAFYTLLFFIICFSVLSQTESDSATNNLQQIINKIFEEGKQYQPIDSLTKKQNKILLEKNEAKVNAELRLLKPDFVITEGKIYEEVNSIFKKIIQSNPSIPQNSMMVLSRKTDYNAFTFGENIIFIQLGLIYQLKNEEEIAMVIGHELAHNTLKHNIKSLIQHVKLVTNDSIQNKIDEIKRQEFGKVSALNALLAPRLFESRELSRKHEYEADSLGLIYLLNANFDVKKALPQFQVMEQIDKNQVEILDLNRCFQLSDLEEINQKTQNYRKIGSLGVFEEDTSKLKSYLATHPYSRDRFVKLALLQRLDTTLENYTRIESEMNIRILEDISFEIIDTEIKNKNLTLSFYYLSKTILANPDNSIAYEYMNVLLRSLAFLKERRTSGKYLMLQNPSFPEDLDRVAAFLYALSPTDCRTIAKKISSKPNLQNDESSLTYKIHQLLDFTENQQYDLLEAFCLTNYADIKSSRYNWIATAILKNIYDTKRFKFLIPYIK